MNTLFSRVPLRQLIRLTVAFTLGIATTATVSWTLSILVQGRFTPVPLQRRGFSVDLATEPLPPTVKTNAELAEVMVAKRAGTRLIRVGPVIGGVPYESAPELLRDSPLLPIYEDSIRRGTEPWLWCRADGWPALALSTHAYWDAHPLDGPPHVVHGIVFGNGPHSPSNGVAALPLQPIWPGFLINSLLYALIWWALLLAGSIRPMLRRRAGLCAKCGYRHELASGPCSECGHVDRPV
jgi:hypothetical protein